MTTINFFFPNETDLVQPCDSFIIQKIKHAWWKRWDNYNMALIWSNTWTEGVHLSNPRKSFFLRFSTDAVAYVNAQRDKNGLKYARKAIIIFEMALNTNGKWEEGHLKPELQRIINKHRDQFENPDRY